MLVALLLVGFAVAQHDAPHEYSTHEHDSSDREQLGFGQETAMTWEETVSKVAGQFSKVDTNGDGRLDFQELHSRYAAHVDVTQHEKEQRDFDDLVEATFMNFDKDSSGGLSPSEYEHTASGLDLEFDFFDEDRNGALDKEEFRASQSPYSSGRAADYVMLKANEEIDRIANGGSSISWEQYKAHHHSIDEDTGQGEAHLKHRFEDADRNADGRLDEMEYKVSACVFDQWVCSDKLHLV
jgi:Ca2+-binding EF-hand superfamily protein